MSNKDKQTMDYWRHSTNLYEETSMELAVSAQGFEAYGVYCFLMAKVNYDINLYESCKILTNYSSNSSEDLIISKRQSKKNT